MKNLSRIAALSYFIATLPLIVLVAWNPSFRFDFANTVSHYRSKVAQPNVVLLGNSIAAGGGVWGWRLSWSPMSAVTLAQSGYTIRQVRLLVPTALSYSPGVVVVMAGVNDVSHPRYSLDFSLSEYRAMVESIRNSGVRCIVTLVPYQASTDKRVRIDELNDGIRQIAESLDCKVIDLNPTIAPDGVLLDGYTTDGVHFSEAAYDVWSAMLVEAMNHGDSTAIVASR